MKTNYENQLKHLAETLVTPERFGALAMAEIVEIYPKAEVLEFPLLDGRGSE